MKKKKIISLTTFMTVICVIGGLFLTRLSGSVHPILGAIFNLGSIILFLLPIAYELYLQEYKSKTGPKTTDQEPLFSRDLLYKLLVAAGGFFLMLFGIKWLQGKPLNFLETLNTAIILSFVFYIYQTYLKPYLPFGQKKDETL